MSRPNPFIVPQNRGDLFLVMIDTTEPNLRMTMLYITYDSGGQVKIYTFYSKHHSVGLNRPTDCIFYITFLIFSWIMALTHRRIMLHLLEPKTNWNVGFCIWVPLAGVSGLFPVFLIPLYLVYNII